MGFGLAFALKGCWVELDIVRAVPVLGYSRLGVPAAFATAGSMLDLLFNFIDPCAGRHLLSLLRQRK
jgi:hypothetical protein